jgi:hypothetical protein
MTYYEKAKDIYDKIYSGRLMEAFEEYYHEDCVLIEATGEVRKGKAANREAEFNFINNVQEWRGGGVNSITANEEEGITMIESWLDVMMENGKPFRLEQIARQKWLGDQIIEERFYFTPAEVVQTNKQEAAMKLIEK